MTAEKHIEEGERLLEKAKDVSRRPKETDVDRKNDQVIYMDLLDCARTHFAAAQAVAAVNTAENLRDIYRNMPASGDY